MRVETRNVLVEFMIPAHSKIFFLFTYLINLLRTKRLSFFCKKICKTIIFLCFGKLISGNSLKILALKSVSSFQKIFEISCRIFQIPKKIRLSTS